MYLHGETIPVLGLHGETLPELDLHGETLPELGLHGETLLCTVSAWWDPPHSICTVGPPLHSNCSP